MEVVDGLFERSKKLQSFAGDADGDDAAIRGFAGAGSKSAFFEAVGEAGDVGIAGDHAAGDFAAGESVGAGSTEDTEDVVLGGGDTEGIQKRSFFLEECVGGAEEIEEGFFFEGVEGLGLFDLLGELAGHAFSMIVATNSVKRNCHADVGCYL